MIEQVDGTIAITRIHVKYRITLREGQQEAAERALELHQAKCPVAKTLTPCVDISWEAKFEEEKAEGPANK